ncbi:MAG: 50S ribosomal protein L3 [bacterium]|nr:50S ribosomal protein L3 [bacterium]
MGLGILGKKLGMTQVFDEKGEIVPVTAIKTGACLIVQKKIKEKDGYDAIQVGFDDIKKSRLNKPILGHFEKAEVSPKRYLREFRVADASSFEIGKELRTEELFQEGEKVSVSSTSKGKGFQGVIKRHGFRGGKASHGSMFHRAPGSIGTSTDPSRVLKGKKLPGRMGGRKVTIKNIQIVKIDSTNQVLLLKGAIPGHRGGLVIIKKRE